MLEIITTKRYGFSMNIFYLDSDPKVCAKYHCDKHVVKMILESAQLLCTALNVSVGEQITPYKTTHVNHPCSIWVRENYSNWSYVWKLMFALEKEWGIRYNHKLALHKSVCLLSDFFTELPDRPELFSMVDLAEEFLPNKPLTKPALAMPDYCKISDNPVLCYREYYRKEKQDLLKYTNREKPFWLES